MLAFKFHLSQESNFRPVRMIVSNALGFDIQLLIHLRIHGRGVARPYRKQDHQPSACAKPHRQIEYSTSGSPVVPFCWLGRLDYQTRHTIKTQAPGPCFILLWVFEINCLHSFLMYSTIYGAYSSTRVLVVQTRFDEYSAIRLDSCCLEGARFQTCRFVGTHY
jgi:hypothetical protein